MIFYLTLINNKYIIKALKKEGIYMVKFCDDDVKIYTRYSEEDIQKYINFYLRSLKAGISFDAIFFSCQKYLRKKERFLELLHEDDKKVKEQVNVNDVIEDYTTNLLSAFYTLNASNEMFNYVERNFIERYVLNESEIEGIDYKTPNSKEFKEGLEIMYRFLLSKENNSTTGSIMLTDLHEKLFSHVEYGKYARQYRTDMRFFPGTGIELEDPYLIPRCMRQADRQFDELYEEADRIYHSSIDDRLRSINSFLVKLMKYKIEIIRIHPFSDGNKRSTRGIVNFLLKRAGLPPVYVKFSEVEKYQEALIQAMKYGDYITITNFYKNKLCDSIEELVINPFLYAIQVYNDQVDAEIARKQAATAIPESNVLRLLRNEDKKKDDKKDGE